ncbi:LacI family DNA-binding transcriptional regulator [Compostimonas suwonensis]|uniref:LacI family transcriptional regulator n=1 Tax=Compostimonas suwonensis TaxID=1048394 RepID=A0A2M9C4B7_9MICO|nr:LacI family DNA-binding transcriptional regulator [Compostimonas suwonensis]PJJ65374.1 LacI family transcriptional regulator [Compostimonas suwonensis]
MATLSDVAKRAGVSISAASRVLSDAPATRVSDETRQRIHAAAKELDYRPNFAGRALKFARSNALALIVPDLTNAIFTELMEGVEEEALERDYMVLLGRAEDMQPGGEAIDKLIGEGRVDGILVQLSDHVTPAEVERLLEVRAPVIFINSVEPNHVGAVTLQDDAGARLATEHLIGLGHARIGFVGGVPSSYTAGRRAAGFREAMDAAGLPVDPAHVTALGYEPRAGREALRTIMAAAEPPTAIFVSNVNAAIGVLAEARSIGVRIPEDLSVVAMHDAWTAENSWPPLTTVKMPLRQLGRLAVSQIVSRLQGDEERRDVVVASPAPQLIVRESAIPLGA